jgi:hypothetical protein
MNGPGAPSTELRSLPQGEDGEVAAKPSPGVDFEREPGVCVVAEGNRIDRDSTGSVW